MKMLQSLPKKIMLMLLVFVVFTACSKSEKDPIESDNDPSIAEHTFDITLVNKSDGSETVEYKGAVPTDKGNAIYKDLTISGNRDHSVTMLLGKRGEPGNIFGIINLDDNNQPIPKLRTAVEQDGSVLMITPEGKDDYYNSVSGTVKFSDLKYALPISSSGAACFTLKFSGDFEKNSGRGTGTHIYQGTGTIVVSPEKKMGTYKAP